MKKSDSKTTAGADGVPVVTTAEIEAIAQALSAPFENSEVKFKPQHVSGNRALVVPFVDARVIQDRLDDVLGVMGWQDSYQCLPDGAVVCRLCIRLGVEWITKEDVGGQSEQPDEGDRRKAAFSDALKRAAVKFGIGRYLYRLKPQWVDYDPQKRQLVGTPRLPGPVATPAPAEAPAPAPVAGACSRRGPREKGRQGQAGQRPGIEAPARRKGRPDVTRRTVQAGRATQARHRGGRQGGPRRRPRRVDRAGHRPRDQRNAAPSRPPTAWWPNRWREAAMGRDCRVGRVFDTHRGVSWWVSQSLDPPYRGSPPTPARPR